MHATPACRAILIRSCRSKSRAPVDAAEAYGLNTLGVAYTNQRRPSDAQNTLNDLSQVMRCNSERCNY
jgi:hypothetical protein